MCWPIGHGHTDFKFREDARGGSGGSIDPPKFCLTKSKNFNFHIFPKSVVMSTVLRPPRKKILTSVVCINTHNKRPPC